MLLCLLYLLKNANFLIKIHLNSGVSFYLLCSREYLMVRILSVDDRNRICLKVNNLKYCFIENILLWYSFWGKKDLTLTIQLWLLVSQR